MLKNDLGRAIIHGACNTETKDFAVELTEELLDALLQEGVLKEIPILKGIIACRKAWTGIHDYLFLRKVANFLLASTRFTREEQESFTQEYLTDSEKAQRLGDSLLLILDKLDDL